jgi:hypothetical protein
MSVITLSQCVTPDQPNYARYDYTPPTNSTYADSEIMILTLLARLGLRAAG